MFARIFSKSRAILPFFLALLVLFLTGWLWLVIAPTSGGQWLQPISILTQSQQIPVMREPHFLNGKLASLNWIVGRDCQRSVNAYLQTASTNPDAAVVGTG